MIFFFLLSDNCFRKEERKTSFLLECSQKRRVQRGETKEEEEKEYKEGERKKEKKKEKGRGMEKILSLNPHPHQAFDRETFRMLRFTLFLSFSHSLSLTLFRAVNLFLFPLFLNLLSIWTFFLPDWTFFLSLSLFVLCWSVSKLKRKLHSTWRKKFNHTFRSPFWNWNRWYIRKLEIETEREGENKKKKKERRKKEGKKDYFPTGLTSNRLLDHASKKISKLEFILLEILSDIWMKKVMTLLFCRLWWWVE